MVEEKLCPADRVSLRSTCNAQGSGPESQGWDSILLDDPEDLDDSEDLDTDGEHGEGDEIFVPSLD